MNVEFVIHGVLSGGQSLSTTSDTDYYKQFYSEQEADTILTVEVVNRPHDVSTYYNYLRSKNVTSTREGSYFGMTIRVDEAYCRDVKSMYLILETLFNKMIVGRILSFADNRYSYLIDSFTSQRAKEYIGEVEKRFKSMYESLFSTSDSVSITAANVSGNRVYSLNPADITTQLATMALRERVKLYVSPAFASSQTAAARKQLEKERTDADARVKAVERSKEELARELESRSQTANKRMKDLEGQVQMLQNEKSRLTIEIQRVRKDSEILEALSGIKTPLIQLATLLQQRFPEVHRPQDRVGQDRVGKQDDKHKAIQQKKKSLFPFLKLFNSFLGVLILCVVLWSAVGIKKSDCSTLVKQHEEAIEQLEQRMANIKEETDRVIMKNDTAKAEERTQSDMSPQK